MFDPLLAIWFLGIVWLWTVGATLFQSTFTQAMILPLAQPQRITRLATNNDKYGYWYKQICLSNLTTPPTLSTESEHVYSSQEN